MTVFLHPVNLRSLSVLHKTINKTYTLMSPRSCFFKLYWSNWCKQSDCWSHQDIKAGRIQIMWEIFLQMNLQRHPLVWLKGQFTQNTRDRSESKLQRDSDLYITFGEICDIWFHLTLTNILIVSLLNINGSASRSLIWYQKTSLKKRIHNYISNVNEQTLLKNIGLCPNEIKHKNQLNLK